MHVSICTFTPCDADFLLRCWLLSNIPPNHVGHKLTVRIPASTEGAGVKKGVTFVQCVRPWVKGEYLTLGKTQIFRSIRKLLCQGLHSWGWAILLSPSQRQPGNPIQEFNLFFKNSSATQYSSTVSASLRLWSRFIDYFLICALLNSHIRLTVTYMASFALQQCPISSYYEEHNGSCVVAASLTTVGTWSMVHRAGPGPGKRFITKSKGWLLAWHPALESWFSNVPYVRNT